jgi:CHAT domain-containing protein
MTIPTLTKKLFQKIQDTPDYAEQKALLDAADLVILSPLSTLLAEEVDTLKHDEPPQAAQMADLLLYLASLSANPHLRALALRAKGEVALFGQHDYAAAHDAYTEAHVCYEQDEADLELAEVEARLVCTLALEGCWDDAQRRFQSQQALLERHQVLMPLAEELKKEGDKQTQKATGIPRATQFAKLILYLADLASDDFLEALGLRAEGNVHLFSHQHQEAVDCYDKAAQLYRRHEAELEAAWAEIGAVSSLAHLGRLAEAEAVYERISQVFRGHKQLFPLAAVTGNLTIMYKDLGKDVEALHLAEQARALFYQLGSEGESSIPRIENNRAISLRNLGRFEESIQASQIAVEINMTLGQTAEAARALQNMAFTYFLLGHYNQALQLYEEVRKSFLSGGRERDALIADLEAIDCLLQLRRFNNVLEKCAEVQDHGFGLQMNLAQSYLHQATAYTSKYPAEYDKALQAVSQARAIFEKQGNQVWMAMSDLQVATIFSLQGKDAESLTLAQSCAGIFRDHALPVNEAQAWLTAARVALKLKWHDLAYRLLLDASNIIAVQPKHTLPFLDYQIHHLLGRLAQRQAKYQQAEAEYRKAIENLELLRGRVMVELTAGFLEDKQSVYEELVTLYLKQLKDYPKAWTYAERAKSRALIDLLVHRIDLTIRARSPEDEPLVQELMALRAERSRLYRRLQERRRMRESTFNESVEREQQAGANDTLSAEQELLGLEQQLEEKWNGLLQRNADYERDVSLSVVSLERVQAYLEPECCLIEYFIAHGQVFAFLITHNSIDVQPLAPLSKVKRWLKLLEMNLKAVPSTKLSRIPALTTRAKGLLHHLYRLLMQPLAKSIKSYRRLVIVPHGILHALPFHALYDKEGQAYLLEQYELSYLPSASLLHYCQPDEQVGAGTLILAHTQGGTLPGREREGRLIQELTKGAYLLDEEATLKHFHQQAPTCRILHLATHGQFKADNPLFSGLALEDGELTTLDIFNSRLSASLVVLSACETARAKLGGGDELLGLSRAFLYAGATSLVVSQWKVEDQSTEQLMGAFYQHLMAGSTKAEALRKAQQQFIQQKKETIYTHPFFWSAFFLMGDAGEL